MPCSRHSLWRGAPLPLASIAVVRTISFTIYTNTKHLIGGHVDPHAPVSSYASTSRSAWVPQTSILNVAFTSSIAGAASGAIVTMGSCPFELVKVRRQLEFQIARDRMEHFQAMLDAEGTSKKGKERARLGLAEGYKPPGTWEAVKDITKERGMRGLWTGFRLHASESAPVIGPRWLYLALPRADNSSCQSATHSARPHTLPNTTSCDTCLVEIRSRTSKGRCRRGPNRGCPCPLCRLWRAAWQA